MNSGRRPRLTYEELREMFGSDIDSEPETEREARGRGANRRAFGVGDSDEEGDDFGSDGGTGNQGKQKDISNENERNGEVDEDEGNEEDDFDDSRGVVALIEFEAEEVDGYVSGDESDTGDEEDLCGMEGDAELVERSPKKRRMF